MPEEKALFRDAIDTRGKDSLKTAFVYWLAATIACLILVALFFIFAPKWQKYIPIPDLPFYAGATVCILTAVAVFYTFMATPKQTEVTVTAEKLRAFNSVGLKKSYFEVGWQDVLEVRKIAMDSKAIEKDMDEKMYKEGVKEKVDLGHGIEYDEINDRRAHERLEATKRAGMAFNDAAEGVLGKTAPGRPVSYAAITKENAYVFSVNRASEAAFTGAVGGLGKLNKEPISFGEIFSKKKGGMFGR